MIGVTVVIILSISLLLLLFFGPINRLSKRKGELSRRWQFYVLLSWTGIWLLEDMIASDILEKSTYFSASTFQYWYWGLIIFTLICCGIAYGIIYLALNQKSDIAGWEDKLRALGKKE